MAELAIPILALGSLYVVSQNEKKQKENYANLNKKNIATNYPTPAPVTENNSLNYYPNSNQSTDKYFNQSQFDNTINEEDISELEKIVNISSLTGNPVARNDFKHNNMVPFFGAKIRGSGSNYNQAESTLDNLQGQGSQYFTKKETAPLFQPEKNLSFANGAPDSTGFYLSRQNPSMNYANVKPWETEQVGPGLCKGYTTKGSDGFNAGMEARECWLPKTVDELRAQTNPKITFGLAGHQGPALSSVTNVGIEGLVEKNHPDTFFQNTPNRWFTTVGAEKGERQRGEVVLKDVDELNCEYFGVATDGEATYVRGHAEDPHSQVLPGPPVGGVQQPNGSNNQNAFGRDRANLVLNNRNTTANQEAGGLHGALQAAIAPILDVLKPTRKENVVGNLRKNGNVNNNSRGNYINNPYDRTRVTNRQMTENKVDLNHLNVEAGRSDGYLVSQQRERVGQRPTTNNNKFLGVGGGTNQQGDRSVENVLNQRNNCNKQQNSVVLPGNMDLFTGSQYVSTLRDDCPRINTRWYVPNGNTSIIPTKDQLGTLENQAPLSEITNRDRIQPDILEAFKQNPYTQSLSSWAGP